MMKTNEGATKKMKIEVKIKQHIYGACEMPSVPVCVSR